MAQQDTTPSQGVSPEQEAELARRSASQDTDSGDTQQEPPQYTDQRHPGRSIMDQIAANRRRTVEQETGEDLSETGAETSETGAPSGADETGAAETATPDSGTDQDAGASQADTGQAESQDGETDAEATGTGEQAGVDPNTPVTVKIYGQEQQIPLWQLQRDYQVNAAGHQKLQEANRRLARAQEIEQQLQQGQPAQQPAAGAEDQPIGQPNQQERAQAATDQDTALQIANALQFGDQNEAVQAIQQIMQQGRGQGDTATPDPNQIAQQATQQVREQMAQEHAINTFRQEYPEVFQDQYLAGLAADAANDLKRRALKHIGYPQQQVDNAAPQAVEQVWRDEQRNGVLPSDIHLFRAAGDEVRARAQQWAQTFSGQNGGQQPTQPQQPAAGQQAQPTGQQGGMDQKRAAKRQQAAPTTGRNQAASLGEQGPDLRMGSNPSEVVQNFKKQRGQQT